MTPPRRLVLWVPATAAGTAAALVPLWTVPASLFLLVPLAIPVYAGVGLVLLGCLQWALTPGIARIGHAWPLATGIGGAAAITVGFFPAALLSTVSLPVEVTWATLAGGGLGLAQGIVLDRATTRPDRR